MKRPSFQFYPADWRNNAKLRRCSEAARGAWMDILCVLHDSDEYGICRWPLADLARAAGVPMKLAKELAAKDVLKGADKGAAPYIYTPRHAGKNGDPVTLVMSNDGPCWYCSRFVRDEWVRQRRGASTQFTTDKQPPKDGPKETPKAAPKGGLGERQGYGPTSTSPSTTEKKAEPKGSDAGASLSPAEALFQVAVPWLVDRGVADKAARSLLGGARKQLGDAGAWELASECISTAPLEPASWIAAALNARIKRPVTGRPNTMQSRSDANIQGFLDSFDGNAGDPMVIDMEEVR